MPAVWQMRRKHNIKAWEIKKHKACLNIDGSKMRQGLHYDQTYTPVASWNPICLLLILVAIEKWHTQQINYVLAFPQAPAEKETHMKPQKDFQITEDNSDKYILQLNKNVYDQKQASQVWNKYQENKLVTGV